MILRSRSTRFALALAAGGAFVAPALAQDPAPPSPESAAESPPKSAREEAADLLVTASRRADAAYDLPWIANSLGSDEFVRDRSRRTLPDALLDLPGVMVQRTSYGQASPFLRGFTGYHTVFLVDGIRLNNSTFRSGPNQYWSTVDAMSVDRLEVVRGPTSVLYGSDAVGGTVNAVLRRRTSFEPGFHTNGRAHVRWASAEDSWVTRIEGEGNDGALGALAGFTYRAYDDFRAGSPEERQDQTGYREQDGDIRLDWLESDCSTWSAGYQHVNQDDVPRTHRTLDAVPFSDTTIGDELRRDLTQVRDLVYLRNRRRVDGAFADLYEWTISYHRQEETQVRDRDTSNPAKRDIQGYTVGTVGFQAHFEKETAIGLLSYGVEMWDDDVSSFRTDYEDGVPVLDRVQGPVADDASYRMLGIYAQDEFSVGATNVTAGARWTRASADANTVDNPLVGGGDPATPGNVIGVDDSWSTVVGSLRAVHPVAKDWNVFGGVSQGFRAPNLSDLTRLDDTSGVETPSTDLDPEHFTQFELGVKTRGERWTAQAGVWRTRIRDLIVPSPTGALVGSTPEVRKDNVGDGWASGVEVDAAYKLDDDWTATFAGTWQDGEVDQLLPTGAEVRRPLSRMMPLTVALGATYHEPGSNWRAWGSARFADNQDQLSLKDATDTERIPPGGTPGYGVFAIGASIDLDEHATLSAVLDNVFDKNYRIHGSGVNEPGRSLILAIDFRF